MLGKWKSIYKKLQKAKAPERILGELGRVSAILRDILNDSFNRIIVDSDEYSMKFLTICKQLLQTRRRY